MEQARTFITRVAMFEVKKKRYWEAFLFIDKHDRFLLEKEAIPDHFCWGATLYKRVCIEFLKEFVKESEEFIPIQLIKDKSKLACHIPLASHRQELEKYKNLADEAFEEGDFTTAEVLYSIAMMEFPDEMSRFLSDAAALAKSKEMWSLLDTVGELNANLLEVATLGGILPEEDTERLHEAKAMISIALRRMLGFDLTLDVKMLRDPMKKYPGGKKTITMKKLRSIYPMATKNWLNESFIQMADFKGRGDVTVDEFSHFMNICLEAELITKKPQ